MKIALLGNGKTGGKVVQLHNDVTVFDTKNSPTVEKLKGHDVIISFLAGPVFLEYIPILLDSEIPVVTASTGFKWPDNFQNILVEKKLTWVFASNFSLGMNLVHQMINTMGKAQELFSKYQFSLHEIHHTKKLDAPSGTALSWQSWLNQNQDINITHERIGDVVGDHALTLETANERITLRHEAKDRKVFAEGALWAAKKIMNKEIGDHGLHSFAEITKNELLK